MVDAAARFKPLGTQCWFCYLVANLPTSLCDNRSLPPLKAEHTHKHTHSPARTHTQQHTHSQSPSQSQTCTHAHTTQVPIHRSFTTFRRFWGLRIWAADVCPFVLTRIDGVWKPFLIFNEQIWREPMLQMESWHSHMQSFLFCFFYSCFGGTGCCCLFSIK